MTPFRNDESNPFIQESIWPKLPQTPLPARVRRSSAAPRSRPSAAMGGWVDARTVGAAAAPAVEAEPTFEAEPLAAPILPRAAPRPARLRVRLTPLISAARQWGWAA